jgi:hypothetical protein
MKKISFPKNPAPANRIESVFSSAKCFGIELVFQKILLRQTELRACFHPQNASE